MHGLKSAILAIFQKSVNWLDFCIGHALVLRPSKITHRIFFLFYISIYVFGYETIVRSSAWSFGHSDPDPSSVILWKFLRFQRTNPEFYTSWHVVALKLVVKEHFLFCNIFEQWVIVMQNKGMNLRITNVKITQTICWHFLIA